MSNAQPFTITHAKLAVGGSETQAALNIAFGNFGPLIHLLSLIFSISVDFEEKPSSDVRPPSIMMQCIDPSSEWMAQLEWQCLCESNDGPSIQWFSLVAQMKVRFDGSP